MIVKKVRSKKIIIKLKTLWNRAHDPKVNLYGPTAYDTGFCSVCELHGRGLLTFTIKEKTYHMCGECSV